MGLLCCGDAWLAAVAAHYGLVVNPLLVWMERLVITTFHWCCCFRESAQYILPAICGRHSGRCEKTCERLNLDRDTVRLMRWGPPSVWRGDRCITGVDDIAVKRVRCSRVDLQRAAGVERRQLLCVSWHHPASARGVSVADPLACVIFDYLERYRHTDGLSTLLSAYCGTLSCEPPLDSSLTCTFRATAAVEEQIVWQIALRN